MPELTENQKRQVREEVAHQLRPVAIRMWIWGLCLVLSLALGAGLGVYAYSQTQNRDQERALQLSKDNCTRSQGGRRALALIVHTAIPPHQKGRSADEQKQVDRFYRKVAPALRVPSCT